MRVSTPRQTASLDLQRREIDRFANEQNYEIVATYEDVGKSGLTLQGRDGLSRLLSDVISGRAQFTHLLVLDVSRWGRFQDPDEAGHYEFVCRAHGVSVTYCRDIVRADARGHLVKQVRRVMAAEYVRQLSDRVRQGKRRAMEAGRAPGAWPRFMADRQLAAPDADSCSSPSRSEPFSPSADAMRLVRPGRRRELVIRRIFRLFTSGGMSMAAIARSLTDDGLMWTDGTPWNRRRVARALRHSLAMGVQTYGRSRTVLGARGPELDESRWGEFQAFDPVISKQTFAAAQARFAQLGGRKAYSNEELLAGLDRLVHLNGRVTVRMIDECPDLPSFRWYEARFGSLTKACQMIGYERPLLMRGLGADGAPLSRQAILAELRRVKAEQGRVTAALVAADPRLPSLSRIKKLFGSLTAACAEAECA